LILLYIIIIIILNIKSEITTRYRIEFDKKVKKFRNRYTINIYGLYNSSLDIYIDRKSIFYDAYYQIMNKSPYELKRRLIIKYKGEEGIDAGGLLR